MRVWSNAWWQALERAHPIRSVLFQAIAGALSIGLPFTLGLLLPDPAAVPVWLAVFGYVSGFITWGFGAIIRLVRARPTSN
jgi:hypothetical protein